MIWPGASNLRMPGREARDVRQVSFRTLLGARAPSPAMSAKRERMRLPESLLGLARRPDKMRARAPALPVLASFAGQRKLINRWESIRYQAQAYASVRGSAPALITPVFRSITMAASEPSDHGPVTRSLWPRARSSLRT